MSKRGDKKDPAFLFYVTTWLQSAETNSMSLEQQGAYVRLLCFAWLHGSIPADREEIRHLIGLGSASEEAFARVWSGRLPRCWVEMPGTPGRLINERQEHERKERRERTEEMRARGQAGGKQSAELRASGGASRGQADAQAGGQPGGQAGPQPRPRAGGQAEAKPSTTTSTEDSQIARGTSPLGEEGVPTPSDFDEERAAVARSLVAGAAAARRTRA